MLSRLEEAGWLSSSWEEQEASALGRPRKRLYVLTGLGQRRAREHLQGLQVSSGELTWAF
jgi:DNA-binding PadR family transcriptional regulator